MDIFSIYGYKRNSGVVRTQDRDPCDINLVLVLWGYANLPEKISVALVDFFDISIFVYDTVINANGADLHLCTYYRGI